MKAKDFRKQAYKALENKWGTAVLSILIFSLIIGALSVVFNMTGIGSTFLVNMIIEGPSLIVTSLVAGPLQLGLVMVCINIIRGKETTIENLFDGFKNFTTSFTLYLVNNIFIALWSLLLIVPGIIKNYAYSMSYYILNDNPKMSQSEARKASIEMMKGHKWELFCLQFSFIGWYLLSIFTFGILSLWVSAYLNVATAAFYENLKKVNAPTVSEETNPLNEEYDINYSNYDFDINNDANYCPHCHNKVKDDAIYCNNCGEKLPK